MKQISPPKEDSWFIFRRLLRYVRPYRKTFAFSLLAMVLYGITDGAIPFLIKSILDDIFGKQNQDMLYLLPAAIVAFALIRGIFGFLQQYLMSSIGLWIVRDLRQDLAQKLLMLTPHFYSSHTTGELVSRVNNDTLIIRQALTEAVSSLLKDSIRIFSLLVAATYLDPVLTLIAFTAFPLGLLPMIQFGKKVKKQSRFGQERLGGLASILQEIILGHRVVQAFNMEPHEQERFRAENNQLTGAFRRAEKYAALSAPTNEFIASIAIAAVILYGGFSVMSGVRTQGDFIAFITALFLLYEPFKKLGRMHAILQASIAAGERVFAVLDTVPDVQSSPTEKPLIVREPRIEYQGVSFYYPSATDELRANERRSSEPRHSELKQKDLNHKPNWALQDINLSCEPGQTLALVGMSGGGKSTIVSLLPRFYDPQRGAIFISGTNIKDVSLASLRQVIAVVSQHTFLFNDTIFNNIAYGRRGASREEVITVAEAANADHFIRSFPEGYDTIIGEQGLRLSGGERARIAMARALLKDAPILILDEATASLDSESEHLVQQAIDRVMVGRTVLVIAHRLSTIRNADQIVVLVNGRVVEQGSHDQLIERGGEYAKLYRLQFQGQNVSPLVREVSN